MLKKFFLIFSIITVLAGAAISWWVYKLVVLEPGDEIRLENIRRILSKESEVYYRDGITKLGVFFDTAHRQYVTFEEIPKTFVNALVASEDERFFRHFGFDPVGIARALVRNIQARKVVQGGSTLTQQTAKNLFKRTDRSFEAKLKELLYALRLEYHYTKEQIFEFYANQFYVSGNGHGFGVAARYYFDKTPEELTLLENAFIAGSVKRPNYYNPFIKKSSEAIAAARSRAKERTRYVLDKMLGLGMIGEAEHREAVAAEIQFKEGKVGFALDHAMELVRDAVSSTDVLNALEAFGVTNIATSGVRIITTVDRDLQHKALASLRGELSRLDIRLRGYDREEVQAELKDLDYTGDSEVREGNFLFGYILEINGRGKDIQIVVELDKELGRGVIDAAGLAEMINSYVKWQNNLWSEPAAGDQEKVLRQLQVGDRVWVSVKAPSDAHPVLLALEKYPQVQGGAMVLKDGVIMGMAGGAENRFFNRAVHARRTMGSSFKPLVYAAALQLGWNTADPLRNSRELFVFNNQPYFPRPDHKSPFEWVSLNWAGVLSENVASVWLLAHLCDRLTPAQFREVATNVGLAPQIVDGHEESYRSYSTRIRDRHGILINNDALRAAGYRKAVEVLETDFVFDGMLDEYAILQNLPYGLNFDRFARDLSLGQQQRNSTMSKLEAEEIEVRRQLLSRSYLQLKSLRKELAAFQTALEYGMAVPEPDPFEQSNSAEIFENYVTGEYTFSRRSQPSGHLSRISDDRLRSTLEELGPAGRDLFWAEIKLDGQLTVEAFDKVEEQANHEFQKLSQELPYSFEVLSQVSDFRITVGLHYLIQLAQQLGIKGRLEPVLSFPLGSNVVTLLEATRMYEGLVTGSVTTFGEQLQEEGIDSLAILGRIESEDGEVLFEPKPVRKQVFDPKTILAIGGILENVVKFGTGKSAGEKVKLRPAADGGGEEIARLNLPVPLLGKTGTANNYTNASFFGYLPGIAGGGEGMVQHDGFAIGTYVGFDDNQPMRRKSSRISGAAGALPTWCEIANLLMQEHGYINKLDPTDISFYGLILKRADYGQVNLGVSSDQGGKPVDPMVPVNETVRTQPAILTFGMKTDTGRFEVERNFLPFWAVAAQASQ